MSMASRSASMHSDSPMDGERPRKRVRKGTRSCWECKRRKVKCSLSSDDAPVCSGCLARGTSCLSQEFPEERGESNGTQVGERLGRVERLLETLVAKISQYEEEENATKEILTPESMGADVLTPYSSTGVSHLQDNAPLMSLFDNAVIGRRESRSQVSTSIPKTMGTKTPSCRPSKIDRLRQALVDLLPSQHDTTLICRASGSWLLTYGLTPQMPGVFEEHNDGVVSSNIDIDEVRKQHPTVVARALLYIAVFLQQLDATFDTNRLHILPSIDSRVEKYLSTVQSLITADDELVSTIEGIECLILQGIFYMNAGSPRRAWLSFRRALTVGQLIGIHKRDYSTTSSVGNQLWQQINKADRYLGLLLGLPVGSLDDRFGPDETFQNPDADKDLIFSRKLGELTGHIISRNQTENTHAYANTQEIDDKLEDLAKQMPKSWWEIPTKLSNDHAKSTAVQFERLMTQIWYFQLVAILHLPFMLRASTERRYDYSKFSCLKASRQMLHRYLKLRFPDTKSFCCRIVDFGALTATVTLFLGVLEQAQPGESDETRKQRKNDHALIQSVLEVMENISRHSKDVVAAQCVEVIKSLMAVESQTAENGKLRLTIPYFGTISIVRPAPVRPPVNKPSNLVVEHQESINFGRTPSQDWSGAPYPTPSASISPESSHVPTVSFYSSQFPQFIPEPQPPIGDLGWHESDTLFFDSLLSTDLEGNWLF